MNSTTYRNALLVAGLGVSCGASAAEWTVVPETSSVAFSASQQGTRFNGRFGEFTAEIDLDAADPTKGTIVGVVEVDSVNTRDHDRDAALVDKDWFNAAQFPQARFESSSIARSGDGFEASGQLTLKGQTKPATLKFTFAPSAAASGGAATAQFAGTMVVNRFDFNVGEGWNDTSWVGQDVTVEVKLDLKR
jgi:polyisoprenoid-binding protein YceI